MDLGLKGKVAMVAGASRGLGYAVAEALAREGALVSISSSNQASIDEAAKRIAGRRDGARHGRGRQRTAIVSAGPPRPASALAASTCCSPTAAGRRQGATMTFDDAAGKNTVELLLFSALRMVRAAVPSMKARGGGSILMSTSASVKEPIANLGLSTVLRASVPRLRRRWRSSSQPRTSG